MHCYLYFILSVCTKNGIIRSSDISYLTEGIVYKLIRHKESNGAKCFWLRGVVYIIVIQRVSTTHILTDGVF